VVVFLVGLVVTDLVHGFVVDFFVVDFFVVLTVTNVFVMDVVGFFEVVGQGGGVKVGVGFPGQLSKHPPYQLEHEFI